MALEKDAQCAEFTQSGDDGFIQQNKGEMRKSFVGFLIGFIVLMSYIYLGALIFFFIEHCWRNDIVQEEQTINKICAAFSKMKEKEKQYISNFSEKMFQQLSCDCPEYLKEHEVLYDLNTKNFFKWCEYTISVCFTTGICFFLFARIVKAEVLSSKKF